MRKLSYRQPEELPQDDLHHAEKKKEGRQEPQAEAQLPLLGN